MAQLNQALLGKLSWRFLAQSDSLRALVIRAKYIRAFGAIQNHPSHVSQCDLAGLLLASWGASDSSGMSGLLTPHSTVLLRHPLKIVT
ncbi:hypothetical protein V2J09_023407 [Rumex salicifolius]